MSDDVTSASKFLAYVLRHDPTAIVLDLQEGGWASIDALLAGAARQGRNLAPTAAELRGWHSSVGRPGQLLQRPSDQRSASLGSHLSLDG